MKGPRASQQTPQDDRLRRELARRLQSLRNKAGYSQARLAALMKVKRTTISNIEGERQSISIQMLFELCKSLRTTPGEFLPSMQEFEDLIQHTVEVQRIKKPTPPRLAAAFSALGVAPQEEK